MKEQIEAELQKLTAEQVLLETRHESMVREEQARQEQFKKAVVRNQNRFQQIRGGIAALEILLKEPKPENGSEPIRLPERVLNG